MNHDMTNEDVLMTLQNSKKPEQTIYVVRDEPNGVFATQGLKRLFGVKEVGVKTDEMAVAIPEYAQVLSFLMETMSAAQDFGLPYVYQDFFEFNGTKYSLHERGDIRVLSKLEK